MRISVKKDNIGRDEVRRTLEKWVESISPKPKRVLLLPPDYTRSHSQAGLITNLLYKIWTPETQVEIMPALGTHNPMSEEEKRRMFGPEIPRDRFFIHDWRNEIVKIGVIPGDYVSRVSGGLVDFEIDVEISRRLLDKEYDLVVSIGQVVPHEVVGMANYTKNILVGCGGRDIINKSHILGAAYGMERIMGRDESPVRKVFDYAEERFLNRIPLRYILTVIGTAGGEQKLNGLFIGRDRGLFEEAVAVSQDKNLTLMEKPLSKVVVYLDPEEYKSTWLGNKAIYRTRMAIADEGELIILAPGVREFGEDKTNDAIIRKYGYLGSKKILALIDREEDLQNNLSAAAHLIHGASEGRFSISYAPAYLSREEIEGAGFNFLPLEEGLKRYNPSVLKDGFNKLEDGEEIFFINNPALGLWALKENFQ